MRGKCSSCKRTKQLLFECKCSSKFCSSCRLPELHECIEMEQFKDKIKLQTELYKNKFKRNVFF